MIPRWRTYLWLAYAALLLTLTHLPKQQIEAIPIHIWDKLAHFVAYGGLGFLTAFARASARVPLAPGDPEGRTESLWRWRRIAVWLAGLLLLAACDEWTQPWIGRSCELDDWIADLIGLLFGLSAEWILRAAWLRLGPRARTPAPQR